MNRLLTWQALREQKNRGWLAFLFGLALATLLFLPFIIWDHGYFTYYGDFNVQQIPFYQLAHDCVRSGNIFWNWNTDLGANFIGSYSFYLLGSPFFWLTLPFPSAAVPYLMAPLLILKFACSSVTAYWLLRRFVRPDYAVIGGLLYAFSGFSLYNVFFNHFHEAIVYFPLMLLGLELYMAENRRGLFGLTVFLSALSNYYFFIGQVFFILIYWFVRMYSDDWHCTMPKFLWLAFEAVVGTAGAAVLLLPSYFAVIQNPRTESMLAGWDLLIYTKPQRLFDILHSFFFPQDNPARPNFFPDADNKWASMSAWLPVFGCTGAIAYFQSRKHTDWLRRMLIILFFCVTIPVLNAMFQLFNWAYYARWYYMLVLMLVLATVRCFEQQETHPVDWKRAFGWSAGITAFFTLLIGLAPKSWKPDEKTGKIAFGLMDEPICFWVTVTIVVLSLLLSYLLVTVFRKERRMFFRWAVGAVACISLIYGWYTLGLGKATAYYSSDFVREKAIEGADKIHLPAASATTYRVDVNDGMDNQAMFWKLPTIQAFHSIVPGSIMEFYPTVGVDRGVGSRPDSTHYALRSLLSTRFLFDYTDDSEREKKNAFETNSSTKMPGWTYYETQNDFRIYENSAYIPMGFTYDAYITREEYNHLSEKQRELVLLKAIVLEADDVDACAGLLAHLDTGSQDYTQSAYLRDCEARNATTAHAFTRDNAGFTAHISLPQDTLVFFSVPYENGWSATVNQQAADICKVNVGFMAVRCPAGQDVTIRFTYRTPGLAAGIGITLLSVALFALYWIFYSRVEQWWRRRPVRIKPSRIPSAGAGTDHRSAISQTADPAVSSAADVPADAAANTPADIADHSSSVSPDAPAV